MSKTSNDKAYERGVKDGQEGCFLSDIGHGFKTVLAPTVDEKEEEIYDKGYAYGSAHRNDKKDK